MKDIADIGSVINPSPEDTAALELLAKEYNDTTSKWLNDNLKCAEKTEEQKTIFFKRCTDLRLIEAYALLEEHIHNEIELLQIKSMSYERRALMDKAVLLEVVQRLIALEKKFETHCHRYESHCHEGSGSSTPV